jgi:hypothetical protein
MDDDPLQRYFLQPASPQQRQYEALRAVIVENLSQKEAATRFGYSYGAFRQLVLQFRTASREGATPPFSVNRVAGTPSTDPNRRPRRLPHYPPLPTFAT